MYELKLCKDGNLKWYQGHIELEKKHVKADVYNSYELAVKAAIEKIVSYQKVLSILAYL